MYNLAIIRDVDLPQLKEMLQQLHKTFWLFSEAFDLTGGARADRLISYIIAPNL